MHSDHNCILPGYTVAILLCLPAGSSVCSTGQQNTQHQFIVFIRCHYVTRFSKAGNFFYTQELYRSNSHVTHKQPYCTDLFPWNFVRA